LKNRSTKKSNFRVGIIRSLTDKSNVRPASPSPQRTSSGISPRRALRSETSAWRKNKFKNFHGLAPSRCNTRSTASYKLQLEYTYLTQSSFCSRLGAKRVGTRAAVVDEARRESLPRERWPEPCSSDWTRVPFTARTPLRKPH
jgi:hypothetical protein